MHFGRAAVEDNRSLRIGHGKMRNGEGQTDLVTAVHKYHLGRPLCK